MVIGLTLSEKLKKIAEEENKKEEEKQKALEKVLRNGEDAEVKTDSPAQKDLEELQGAESEAGGQTGTKNFYPEGLDLDLRSNDPFTQFEKIDEFYRNKKSQENSNEMQLEKLEMPTQTQDDILTSVTTKLNQKYNNLKDVQSEKFDKQFKAMVDKKQSAQKNAVEAEEKINTAYKNSIESAESQAIKRGLARSSIIINQIGEIDGQRAQSLSKLASGLVEDLAKIDKEIIDNKLKQENAFNTFDIDYAIELDEEIKKGMAELEKKKREVVEFNNKVEKTQAEFRLDKEKQSSQLENARAQVEAKYGIKIDNEVDEQKVAKLNYALEYFNRFSRTDALKKLASDNMYAYYLGDLWATVYQRQLARPIR